ncbi:MAG: tetratricopeptide repeat protein [Thermodesulfobacteriota bacterium]
MDESRFHRKIAQGSPLRTAILLVGLFLAFFVVACVLYHPALNAEMYYDSRAHILAKEDVYAKGRVIEVLGTYPQRPITILSFYGNYLYSGMAPFWFRLTNLVMLAMTGVVITVLVDTILGISPQGDRWQHMGASIAAGIVFVIHPILTWGTLYIWQRAALLASMFYVSSVVAYLATRLSRVSSKAAGYAICLLLFEAALFSKENSISLPAVLILAEIAFFSPTWGSLLKRGSVFALVAALSVLGLSLLEHPYGDAKMTGGILAMVSHYYESAGLTLKQVLLTQSRMFFFYLSLIVAPIPSRAQLVLPQVISSSLTDPPTTAIAVLGVAVLVPVGLALLWKRPVWGFGLLFYAVALLPESLLVPEYAYFGYRPIIPMVGILILAADCVPRAFNAVAHWRRAGKAACMVLGICGGVYVGLIAGETFGLAELWRDRVAFWQDVVTRFPDREHGVERTTRVHALYNLGSSLLEQKRVPEALEVFQEACRIAPDHAESNNAAGVILHRLGRLSEAENHLRRAVELKPNDSRARANLERLLKETESSAEITREKGRDAN